MPNILIADDHDLVRETLAAYLGQSDEFKVYTAPSLDEGLKTMAGEIPFDVGILDYNMPGMNGLSGLERAQKQFPVVKFVLMSGVANKDVALGAIDLGAKGFIPKSISATSMVNAIKFVLSGETFFPFDFQSNSPQETAIDSDYGMSPREMETLRCLCQGLSNKEIGRQLDIQEVTVKLHVKNILKKIGVSNRTQAALFAKENHLV